MGAIIEPPSANPPTTAQSILRRLILIKNPTLAEIATMNSAALTVPIIFLGSTAVVVIIVGVTIGPQPPPPDASTKPPVKPKYVN